MPKLQENAAEYYVFEMSARNRREPLRQVNKSPLSLDAAKKLARIGASKGKHDRSVTTSPTSRKFRIVAQYGSGSGKDVAIMYRAGMSSGKPRKKKALAANVTPNEPEPVAHWEPIEEPAEPEPAQAEPETEP